MFYRSRVLLPLTQHPNLGKESLCENFLEFSQLLSAVVSSGALLTPLPSLVSCLTSDSPQPLTVSLEDLSLFLTFWGHFHLP